jgi:hypothetical protein
MAAADNGGTIALRLREISQLFNTLDPYPFRDRDLARDAEEYVTGWAEELPRNAAIRIAVYLPAAECARYAAADVGAVIANCFNDRARAQSMALRDLFRDGRLALLIGVTLLSACLLLAVQVGQHLGEGTPSRIVQESLVILGWVVIWRPAEIFLYEWLPIVRRRALYRRLSAATVILEPSSPADEAARPPRSPPG